MASDRLIDETVLDEVSVSLRAELLSVTIGVHLRNFPLFKDIADSAMGKLSVVSQVMVLTKGDVIESDGQIVTGLHVIVQGEVFIQNEQRNHERRLSHAGFFGQTSMIRAEVRRGNAFAMAENVVEIVSLSRTSFMKVVDFFPQVGMEVSCIEEQLNEGHFEILHTTKTEWEKEYDLESTFNKEIAQRTLTATSRSSTERTRTLASQSSTLAKGTTIDWEKEYEFDSTFNNETARRTRTFTSRSSTMAQWHDGLSPIVSEPDES